MCSEPFKDNNASFSGVDGSRALSRVYLLRLDDVRDICFVGDTGCWAARVSSTLAVGHSNGTGRICAQRTCRFVVLVADVTAGQYDTFL